ncbi:MULTISPECIES: hypothetical protein [Pseudomonas]|uniref:hypothetical protein n=1 Tax=Pseudomonas TaxID=286 RepID=UPI001404F37E|nr:MULTISPECIES: hypothetical protein [Pseudomonas]MBF8748034.1 hypothetical protein [Pseudomonas monteilii]MCT8167181.1 hypothetical protein [Pseudomonas sp. HD6422]MCT8186127.1 hypothetical protein [Pseudomonas sp. HD6421]
MKHSVLAVRAKSLRLVQVGERHAPYQNVEGFAGLWPLEAQDREGFDPFVKFLQYLSLD